MNFSIEKISKSVIFVAGTVLLYVNGFHKIGEWFYEQPIWMFLVCFLIGSWLLVPHFTYSGSMNTLKYLFQVKKYSIPDMIVLFVDCVRISRTQGIVALEEKVYSHDHPGFYFGIMSLLEGHSSKEIESQNKIRLQIEKQSFLSVNQLFDQLIILSFFIGFIGSLSSFLNFQLHTFSFYIFIPVLFSLCVSLPITFFKNIYLHSLIQKSERINALIDRGFHSLIESNSPILMKKELSNFLNFDEINASRISK